MEGNVAREWTHLGPSKIIISTPFTLLAAVVEKAWRSVWSFYLQCALSLLYMALAFALPGAVGYMTEAAHIATLHALFFVAVLVIQGVSSRVIYAGDAPAAFPLTPLLLAAPVIFATVANTLLLPVLGLEAWLQTELGSAFSVLLIVQVLAVAEFVAVFVAGSTVALRTLRYKDAQRGGVHARHKTLSDGGTPSSMSVNAQAGTPAFAIPAYLQNHARPETAPLLSAATAPIPIAISSKTRNALQASGLPTQAVSMPSAGAFSSYNGSDGTQSRSLGGAGISSSPGNAMAPVPAMSSPPPYLPPPTPFSPAQEQGTAPTSLALLQAAQAQVASLTEQLSMVTIRETDLASRAAALSKELVAAASGIFLGDLPILLRKYTEENYQLTSELRAVQALSRNQQHEIEMQQSDLERANIELKQLRQTLHQEKRKFEKLKLNMDHVQQLNANAQNVIASQQQKLEAFQSSGSIPAASRAYMVSLEAALDQATANANG